MKSISQHEERELLLELRNGSKQAFEKIYELYSARLYGNLLKLVKSDTEAQEILQEVFIKIWDNRQALDLEKSFRSWLFKIAENKVYDFFRKVASDKKKQARLLNIASSAYSPIEELLFSKEKTTMLQKAIEALPPQRQQVFRLCKLEGKSYKEVSEQLGISVSTISDHIVKATKALKEYFDNNEQVLLILLAFFFLANA